MIETIDLRLNETWYYSHTLQEEFSARGLEQQTVGVGSCCRCEHLETGRDLLNHATTNNRATARQSERWVSPLPSILTGEHAQAGFHHWLITSIGKPPCSSGYLLEWTYKTKSGLQLAPVGLPTILINVWLHLEITDIANPMCVPTTIVLCAWWVDSVKVDLSAGVKLYRMVTRESCFFFPTYSMVNK